MIRGFVKFQVIFVALFLLAGPVWAGQDAGAQPLSSEQDSLSSEQVHAKQAGADYRVGVGDVLKIEVYDEPDLCGSFQVRHGGSIVFPLIGEMNVAGSTIDLVGRTLSDELGERYLVDPHVKVEVETYGSQQVQILGAVAKPGVFFLEGHTTVLELLALAGGVVSEKSIKEIRLNRKVNGHLEMKSLKLDQLLGEGIGDEPLLAGDVVNVVEGLVVYVSGQVERSGAVQFWDGLTVSRALSEAGGPKEFARMREAYVLRDGERITFNLRRVLKGRDEDILLQPEDQLVIQESIF